MNNKPSAVVWTCLPAGFVKGSSNKVRLSLLASPRLAAGTLGDFQNWPASVQNYQFQLVATGKNGDVNPVLKADPKVLDATMWQALFGAPRVEYALTSFEGAEHLSYHTAPISSAFRETWGALCFEHRKDILADDKITAESARGRYQRMLREFQIYLPPNPTLADKRTDKEARSELLGSLGKVETPESVRKRAVELIDVYLRRFSGVDGFRLNEAAIRDLLQLILCEAGHEAGQHSFGTAMLEFESFHQPSAAPHHDMAGKLSESEDREFHELLTLLGNYPVLQRRLGLILDFELPADNLADQGTISVVVNGAAQPKTQFQIDGARRLFVAAPSKTAPWDRIELVKDGLLNLNAELPAMSAEHRKLFLVETLDSDGAMMKTRGVANPRNTRDSNEASGTPSPETDGVKPYTENVAPALRTGGISIVVADKALLMSSLTKSAEKNRGKKPNEVVFYA